MKRNSASLVGHAAANIASARQLGLMHQAIVGRDGKEVQFSSGERAVEFINCSYLGLDQHPKVVEAYRNPPQGMGVNFCCARTRISASSLTQLEEELSEHFGGRAICFPSLTVSHQAILPLLAGGVLFKENRPVRMLVDRFAHASMKFLLPILAQEAAVEEVPHNDLEALEAAARRANKAGEVAVFLADTIYSMGGRIQAKRVLELSRELGFYLYLDDAHGTSVYGDKGEGYFLDQIEGGLPDNVFLAFSLSKGYGANGGGVAVPTRFQEETVRNYGMPYAFSAALDFSVVAAVAAALELHRDGTVAKLQKKLWSNLERFAGEDAPDPIAMFKAGHADRALELGSRLKQMGFFVSTVFFPVVPRGNAQLRACITAAHTEQQLDDFKSALNELGVERSCG